MSSSLAPFTCPNNLDTIFRHEILVLYPANAERGRPRITPDQSLPMFHPNSMNDGARNFDYGPTIFAGVFGI